MLRSYLRLTFRTLRRHLGYSLSGSVGLTVGLACVCLVGLYLQFETSYDAFHTGADRIGRIYRVATKNPQDFPNPQLASLVGQQVQGRVAGVEHVTALAPHDQPSFLRRPGDTSGARPSLRVGKERAYYVPPGDGFLQVFDGFEVVRGDAASALNGPGQAVVTAPVARQLFGTVNVIGRTITFSLGAGEVRSRDGEGDQETLTIRAVTEAPPARSHLTFDVVYSVPTSTLRNNWTSAYTYLKLRPGTDRETVRDAAMPAWDALMPGRTPSYDEAYRTVFEPLRSIHLSTRVRNPLSPPTDPRSLWAFGFLALVILGIVGANFTTLTAVMYAGRSREVGARKALGAHEGQVARQFVFETVVFALLCVPPAVGLATLLTPAFNWVMDTALPSPAVQPLVWLSLAGAAAVLGGLAGLYPARGIARRAAPTLFEGSAFGRTGEGLGARRVLLVAQFALFIALGSGAVLMQQQVQFLQETDLGFEPAGLVEITNGDILTRNIGSEARWGISQSEAFQRQLRAEAAVRSVTSGTQFVRDQRSRYAVRRAGDASAPTIDANWYTLSPNAPEVLGLRPQAGAYFDRPPEERPDSVLVVSPGVAEALGCDTQDLGSSCRARLDFSGNAYLPVVGIVEATQFTSLRTGNNPFVLELVDQARRTNPYKQDLFVRFREGVSRTERARLLERTWEQFAPDTPIQYEALSDRVASFYAQDRRLRTLGLSLTGVALALVVVGLLAITAYLTQLRIKEVAVRKSLGATVPEILRRLNREFVGLLGIAFLIGSALSYLAVSQWFAGYATRIDVSPLVFLAVGAGAFVLAVTAVSARALPAARIDPAKVLRSE